MVNLTKVKASDLVNTIDSDRSTPLERSHRLKILRQLAGLTTKALSEKHGISHNTLKHWEMATSRGLTEKGAEKIVLAMRQEGVQCSKVWLLHGVGEQPKVVDIQFGQKQQPTQPLLSDTQYDANVHKEIELFCQLYDDAITFAVIDDGMEPFYREGDVVGGRRLTGDAIADAVGQHCIIETADKQFLCRQLTLGTQPEHFHAYCTNRQTSVAPVLQDIQLISATPITRIWRLFG